MLQFHPVTNTYLKFWCYNLLFFQICVTWLIIEIITFIIKYLCYRQNLCTTSKLLQYLILGCFYWATFFQIFSWNHYQSFTLRNFTAFSELNAVNSVYYGLLRKSLFISLLKHSVAVIYSQGLAFFHSPHRMNHAGLWWTVGLCSEFCQ